MSSISSAQYAAQRKGLDRLDAQLLLLHTLGRSIKDRAWLMSHDTDLLTVEQIEIFNASVARRMAGESVAYIVGEKEFFGLTFKVDKRVLVPRPDTETLVEWSLECLAEINAPSVLDLGTGSGAIGLSILSKRSDAHIMLVDASVDALDVALGNASALGLAGSHLRGLHSDWFQNIPQDERFDVIVSNPPYIADGDSHLEALTHEPLMALTSGADGLGAIRHIVQDAPRFLKRGGWLLLEHGYDQAVLVRELLTANGFNAVSSRQDLAGIERCSGGNFKLSVQYG